MANAPKHPDQFAKLKVNGDDGMKAYLAVVGLKSSGNKPDHIARYRKWWNSQPAAASEESAAGPSANVAGPSTIEDPTNPVDAPSAAVPVTATSYDTFNQVANVPLLERVLAPKKLKVSAVTLDCVTRLQYTPGAQFLPKALGKDLSQTLQPLQTFVDVLLTTLQEVNLGSEAGENESALRAYMSENLSEVQASDALTAFLNGWNIKVVPERVGSPRTRDAELDMDLEMALQVSKVTAQAEAEKFQAQDNAEEGDNDKAEQAEQEAKVLLKELDVVNCAIQHRLVRWATTFPPRSMKDQLWPTTFSTEERKELRAHINSYVADSDLGGDEISEEDMMTAIKDLQNGAEFPVPMAQSAATIKAILLEVRESLYRARSRSQSRVSQTPSVASRNVSPVKGGRQVSRGKEVAEEASEDDDDDDDEDAGPVVRGKKRVFRSRATSDSVGDLEEDDEDDDYMDHQGRDRKRSRRRSSKVKEVAQFLDEDE